MSLSSWLRSRRGLIAAPVATLLTLLTPAAGYGDAVTKFPMTDKGTTCSIKFSSESAAFGAGAYGLFGESSSGCTKTMRQVSAIHAINQADNSNPPGGTDEDACHFEDPATPTGCARTMAVILSAPLPGDYMVQHYWAGQIYNPVPPTSPVYERWGPAPPGCWGTSKGGEVMQCTHAALHTIRPLGP